MSYMDKLPANHILHPSYSHRVLHEWNSNFISTTHPSSLVWPLFIVDDDNAKQEISSMPGQFRWGVNRLNEALSQPVQDGLKCVILFGVLDNKELKDGSGSFADDQNAPVIKACKYIRTHFPDVLVMTDLCLCGYTDHGHCGIIREKEIVFSKTDSTKGEGPCEYEIDNAKSIDRLATIAVAFAKAGAQVIAPSDMMDGRIGAIKDALRRNGLLSTVSVMSYAAKFSSCFYGPFRDAARSGMAFGDRSLYQLPPGSRQLAIRAVQRDIEEGADFVMVKPGGAYLDICRDVANMSTVPVAVYQVSGEYAMIYHAANAGALDFKSAVFESFLSFRRAGVSIIITYFAPQALAWLRQAERK